MPKARITHWFLTPGSDLYWDGGDGSRLGQDIAKAIRYPTEADAMLDAEMLNLLRTTRAGRPMRPLDAFPYVSYR